MLMLLYVLARTCTCCMQVQAEKVCLQITNEYEERLAAVSA